MGKFFDALEKSEKEQIQSKISQESPPPVMSKNSDDGQRASNLKPQASNIKPQTSNLLEDFAYSRDGLNPHLITHPDISPIITEQYKKLKTFLFHYRAGGPPKTIMITSTLPGEGKSTVAANLAITIAQGIGEHVLLVDCDLRRPNLHKILGVSSKTGLTDYLTKDIDLTQVLVTTDIDKLTFLPSGSFSSKHASELLASEKMKDLINELKTKYEDRYIVFDSTPIHATADPGVLAVDVDSVIMVIMAGRSNRDLVAKAIQSLGKQKIAGTVFNGIDQSGLLYKYKYQYKYYTKYYSKT